MAQRPQPWASRRSAIVAGCWLAITTLNNALPAANPRETAEVLAVRRAAPAVVDIHGQKSEKVPGRNNAINQVNGMGTAVIVDPAGYMLTNFHVVDQVSNVRATLSDGRAFPVTVVVGDRATDIAVLKIEVNEKLPVIDLGVSSDLMVAEPVIAIGNAYGYEHTVTRGVISALHRPVPVTDDFSYHDLIQTDAPINPGNSGGPLLNAEGRMIGVNVAVRVGAQGIAFAIPIDNVLEIAARLIDRQVVRDSSLGIVLKETYNENIRRVIVESIEESGRVGEADVKHGDRLISIAGQEIRCSLDASLAMIGMASDHEIKLQLRRGENVIPVTISGESISHVAQAEKSVGGVTSQRIWDSIGLQVQAVAKVELVRALGSSVSNYGGGLKVVRVRPSSLAASRSIQQGDILIGIHEWQTTSESDLDYVIQQPEMYRDAHKFYLGRSGQILEGELQLANSRTASGRRVSR